MAKKHSFTSNYNDCLKGFPITQLAAYKVLHEGLLGTLGKLGAAGLGAYGLYNYGGDVANAVGNFGREHGMDWLGNAGDKAAEIHQAGKEWTQDSWLGRQVGLGGVDAKNRQLVNDTGQEFLTQSKDAIDSEKNALRQQAAAGKLTPQELDTQLKGVDKRYSEAALRQGEAARDAYWQKPFAGDSRHPGVKPTVEPAQPAAEKQPAPATPKPDQPAPQSKSNTTQPTPPPVEKTPEQNFGAAKKAFLDSKQNMNAAQGVGSATNNVSTQQAASNFQQFSKTAQGVGSAVNNVSTAQQNMNAAQGVGGAVRDYSARQKGIEDIIDTGINGPNNPKASTPQSEQPVTNTTTQSHSPVVNGGSNNTVNNSVNNTMSGKLRTTPSPFSSPSNSSSQPSVAEQVGNQAKNTAIHMGVNTAFRKAASSLTPQPKPPTNNGYGQGKQGQYTG